MAVTGHIVLEGGAEFGGMMSVPDRQAMTLAGGPDAPIRIIPAAAAPDNNHERAGRNAVKWFQKQGAAYVIALPLVDRNAAEDPEIIRSLTRSRLIYLLGGFTHYLAQTLIDTGAWAAVLSAYQAGAVIAGSSAGAMVLCEHYYNHSSKETLKGLDLISGACVIPHHDTFGKNWAVPLIRQLPDVILIGIDEQTGMIDDGPEGMWRVYGKGCITLYRGKAEPRHHGPGEVFHLRP
jgi:cyanophycinase